MALNVELIRNSFEDIKPRGEELTTCFYDLLFEIHPQIKPMFEHLSMKEQGKKLLSALSTIIVSLEDSEQLTAFLKGLGIRHIGYGTKGKHYHAFGECLLQALATISGENWSDELEEAWQEGYTLVASIMQQGAGEAADSTT